MLDSWRPEFDANTNANLDVYSGADTHHRFTDSNSDDTEANTDVRIAYAHADDAEAHTDADRARDGEAGYQGHDGLGRWLLR